MANGDVLGEALTRPYAIPCSDNKKVSMTLDLTGDKYGSLSFEIDDKDYGNAFDTIDITKEYRMIVVLWNDEKIKLLQ